MPRYSVEQKKQFLDVIRERYPTEGPDQIALDLGLSRAAVIIRANRNGIVWDRRTLYDKIQNTRHTNQRLKHNWSLFEPELTPEGAYWLGYIWSDGTVIERHDRVRSRTTEGLSWQANKRAVVLALSEEDQRLLLLRLASKLGLPEDRVRISDHRGRKSHYKGQTITIKEIGYRLKLSGKCFTNLMDRYNIRPRKSFNDPQYPNIPEHLFFDFLRGVIDGDGHVQRQGFGITGSKMFLQEVRERLLGYCSNVGFKFKIGEPKPKKEDGPAHKLTVAHPVLVTYFMQRMHAGLVTGEDYPYLPRKHKPFFPQMTGEAFRGKQRYGYEWVRQHLREGFGADFWTDLGSVREGMEHSS